MKKSDLLKTTTIQEFANVLAEINRNKGYAAPAFGDEAAHCLKMISDQGLAASAVCPAVAPLRTKVELAPGQLKVSQDMTVSYFTLNMPEQATGSLGKPSKTEINAASTVQMIHTDDRQQCYYIDKLPSGQFAVSRDEAPLGKWPTLPEAEKHVTHMVARYHKINNL